MSVGPAPRRDLPPASMREPDWMKYTPPSVCGICGRRSKSDVCIACAQPETCIHCGKYDADEDGYCNRCYHGSFQ